MFGIIIGAAATLGICAYLRHRRRGLGYHAWHYGHCAHRERWGDGPHWRRGPDFGSRGPARWVARLVEHLGATPDQERVIYEATRDLFDELRGLRREVTSTRSDLGAAFGNERLDEERLGELFARHDDLLDTARKAVVGALTKIHDVLDPRQREQLSRWIGRRSYGPYRV